jgi:hypothetical protein
MVPALLSSPQLLNNFGGNAPVTPEYTGEGTGEETSKLMNISSIKLFFNPNNIGSDTNIFAKTSLFTCIITLIIIINNINKKSTNIFAIAKLHLEI